MYVDDRDTQNQQARHLYTVSEYFGLITESLKMDAYFNELAFIGKFMTVSAAIWMSISTRFEHEQQGR